ncbi:ras and EF-hand domain-containing protein homolog isoform X5 [Antedon mediterranea]|uniref:ras and EF-hand domain-containing protein homolog isoform X5 n=1 Tax=Antedon mediterranea TaxID=105859 RepID=UPI003AF42680
MAIINPSPESIQQLFAACDLDGSGFIEKAELSSVCSELSQDELQKVFHELDRDQDGRISITDFSEGFQSVSDTLLAVSRRRRRKLTNQFSSEEFDEMIGKLSSDFELLSCQEQVCELYQQLHSSETPQLLTQFETIIFEVVKDIKQQNYEIERLEGSLKRANDSHSEYLNKMEYDIESQLSKVEQRVRKEERERSELEKMETRRQLEAEIMELQANLTRFQKFEARMYSRDKPRDEMVQELKRQVEELMVENRTLRSNLTEAQTNLALTRSDLATVHSEYDEQMDFITSDRDQLKEIERENDNLHRQVQLLQDANKKLQDTNDDLRSALDTRAKTGSRTPTPGKFGGQNGPSFMSDYLDPNEISKRRRRSSLYYQQTGDGESVPDEADSGNSTMRDPNELDSEIDVLSLDGELRRVLEDHSRPPREISVPVKESSSGKATEARTEGESSQKEPVSEPSSKCSTPDSAKTMTAKLLRSDTLRGSGRKRTLPQVPSKTPTVSPSTVPQQPPDRMYKIVLAGDAAVGKSSFILRLCKGVFHQNLNSTLGVDFQMKTIEIDHKVTTLQLWDTAGQERFRSIAKSYFRRADGVLLLYDCTYERSFINVRDWIEAIEDGAQKTIPVMICANKIDARAQASAEGLRCIRTEDGERLAKSFNALFIETSAKDGSNINEAVMELGRRLRQTEDIEVQQSGLKLTDGEGVKKESKCCDF